MTAVTLRGPKLVLASLAAAALFWPSTAESPVSAAGAVLLSPVNVTLEHQLIHVPAAHVKKMPPRPRVSQATRLALRSSAPQRQESLVSRAGRMLLGDGRYRPDPFPRPDR